MFSLIKRENGRPTVSFERSFEPLRLVDEFFNLEPYRLYSNGQSFVPSLEVKETKDGYVVNADLPGVEEKDLEISVEKNTLTISGKRESEENSEGDTYCACERTYGSFSRSITLPDGLNTENAKAALKGGVLTLHLAKSPEALPKRIQVKNS